MYGEEIKRYLNDNGIKYSFLASELGLSLAVLGTMLNCKRKITIEEYSKICKVLKVDFDFFYTKVEDNEKIFIG